MSENMHNMIGQDLIDESKRLSEKEAQIKSYGAYYQRNKAEILEVAKAMTKINVIGATIGYNCVDLRITGDKHVLQAAFGALRKLGYEPEDRPKAEPSESFSTYWDHPILEVRFWLYFTSTVCHRRKTGTKMVEMPTYETICE